MFTRRNAIIQKKIPAAYCPICNQYIILKSDFKELQKCGAILCEIIDKTPEFLHKNNGWYYDTESRIHSLGYNVSKQSNYTAKQRQIILAYMMENYNISKHEILSIINANIAMKSGEVRYRDAVAKWEEDKKFVVSYKTGDVPQVIINKVIVGRR